MNRHTTNRANNTHTTRRSELQMNGVPLYWSIFQIFLRRLKSLTRVHLPITINVTKLLRVPFYVRKQREKRDSRAEPDGKVEDKNEWKKGMTGEKEKRRRNYRKNYSRDAIVRIATEKQQLPSRIVECLLYYNSYVRFVRSVCVYAYVTTRIDTWSVWIVRGQRCTRDIESEVNSSVHGNWNCNYYSRVIIMYSMYVQKYWHALFSRWCVSILIV